MMDLPKTSTKVYDRDRVPVNGSNMDVHMARVEDGRLPYAGVTQERAHV